VAIKLKGVVMTSSPWPIPAESSDKIRASVPEAQQMANFEPSLAATSSSRSFTSGPRIEMLGFENLSDGLHDFIADGGELRA